MSAPPAVSSGRRKLFVTTALPYANGPFHIGHVMEYIQADIWVRFQRMQGHDVHFVGAEDAHGAPIMLQGGSRGRHAGGARRAHRGDAAEGSRRLPFEFRPLAFDRFAGKRRTVAGYLSPPEGQEFHLHQAGRAVLRSGQGDVPAGSLHPGDVPEVRHPGPVRRRLREMQHRQRTDGPDRSAFDAHRRAAGTAHVAAPVLPAFGSRDRRVPARMDACSRTGPVAATRGAEQDSRMAGRRRQPGQADRLGHLARPAVLRHPDSRRARQVFLRVARCAGRLSRIAEELFRHGKAKATANRAASQSSLEPRTPSSSTSSARTSSISTRCSGRRC